MTKFDEKLAEAQLRVAGELGWNVLNCSDGTVELENWSPVGENILLTVSRENLYEQLKQYCDEFDPDEHCKDLIRIGVKGLPKSVKALINDAYAIDDMLHKLYTAVEEVKTYFEE